MAEQRGARGWAAAWSPDRATGRRREFLWPSGLARGAREIGAQLERWSIAEAAPGRLMPWLPVAFGLGVVVYFTAEREPALWAPLSLAAMATLASLFVRARPVAGPVLIGIAAAAIGFATITLKTTRIAHPILRHAAFDVSVTGFVEVREERERTDRIVVRVHKIEGRRLDEAPDRVRVSVRKGTAPAVGAFIEFKARLNPPLKPLRPGSYDFARDLYFQRIGAIGFASGAIKTVDAPAPHGFWLRYAMVIEGMRDAIDARIRAAIPGDSGSIASALITGKRDAISTPVNDAMYVSSLAHVLSISGYHMVVVAGVVFFVVRALLALWPALAMRQAIKKWAAFAALLAATFYLLLSGVEVAAQRSYIMTAIVLIAVMVDRSALTMRNLAISAVGVLLIAPEAVVHPSFQMSFAATLALIAAYERGLPWATAGANTSFGARMALWGVREVIALILASLVAGLATTPYAAYHFHRLAPYGVIANLLAMPIVSAWVMPAGMLALLAMPFGLDAPLWKLMGGGIDWMITVALFVTNLPGAVGRMAAFGTGPLLVCTAGLLLLSLLRSPLRWSGGLVVVGATLWALRVPAPDVLIGDRGDAVAVRGPTGRLSIMRLGGDAFAAREWLAADADARSPKDITLREGVTCDDIGCATRLADGSIVTLALAAEAFDEDCRRAALIVSKRTAPSDCAATVVDRTIWQRTGAIAAYRTGTTFDVKTWDIIATTPKGYDRPWARAQPVRASAPTSTAPRTPTPRDATPRTEDLLLPDD